MKKIFMIMILIVEDSVTLASRMTSLIQESVADCKISVASDYEEAKVLLQQTEPHVALLDINLPGKNGIEVLKLIRQKNMGCEVIMLTNHSHEYYRTQCQGLGASHFLDKSNDFTMVPELIKQYIIRNENRKV